MEKEYAKLLRKLRRLGIPMVVRGNDVVMVRCPRGIVTIHGSSPSDRRAITNTIGRLRRYGITGI